MTSQMLFRIYGLIFLFFLLGCLERIPQSERPFSVTRKTSDNIEQTWTVVSKAANAIVSDGGGEIVTEDSMGGIFVFRVKTEKVDIPVYFTVYIRQNKESTVRIGNRLGSVISFSARTAGGGVTHFEEVEQIEDAFFDELSKSLKLINQE